MKQLSGSDAALIKQELSTDDPMRLPDFVARIPAGAAIAEVVYAYDSRPARLKCGRPSCPTTHHKGIAFKLTDGHHVIIGHRCGKKHFGQEWGTHLNAFRQKQRRQRAIMRSVILADALSNDVMAVLRSWRSAARDLERHRKQFIDSAPLLGARLREQARQGKSGLFVEEKVDQEIANEIGLAQGRRQPLTRERLIHTVQGLSFFGITSVGRRVEEAVEGIENCRDLALALGIQPSTSRLEKALRDAGESTRQLRSLHSLFLDGRLAMTRENLFGIQAWQKTQRGLETLVVYPDKIAFTSPLGPKIEMILPNIWTHSPNVLDLIEDALEAGSFGAQDT